MPCPSEVLALIERFALHFDDYLSSAYNETQLRREFLDPLLRALGWDVDNEQGHAEAYKDVVHEDAIKIGVSTKAPDYGLRIGGTRKFFLEAKRPAVKIKEDAAAAYQLRRYAWSAKLPLSILTDFEELAVYDCRIKPSPLDKASTARVLFIRYDELPQRWDELAAIFSREAILKGSFDRYAESNKRKRGTAEVDTAFLAEIEGWRGEMAKNIALRNANLSQRELNFAVQRTIDRIIFLRIAEDRGIEDYGRLQSLCNGERIYRRLGEFFRQADERYNSGIFHFDSDAGRNEPPDELTLALELDDKVLKSIVRGLYYPESPYEFSVFSADILGQVYEQFLGKVIKLTAAHRAVVEDKPEVKKAGGVFYTPSYVVDYIVRKTVGVLLTGKSPTQAAKLKILDPACGSGSFLIGAYQFLLDWHLNYYTGTDPRKFRKELFQDARGNWRLTVAERRRVLLNNIFGVDIDSQAVEVTKLSLLLKVLEGASRDQLDRQRRLFHERALPDLGNNIKCGNSLVSPDFYERLQLAQFDADERYRINVFDWRGKDGFAAILKSGGFDAVIGNPPYGAALSAEEYGYLHERFESATRDSDTYSLFIERALLAARAGGLISMIVPTGWYSGVKFSPLRKLFATASTPRSFVSLPYDVFDAWVDTSIFVAEKRRQPTTWPEIESAEVQLRIFPKRHRISTAEEIDRDWKQADFRNWFADGKDEFLTYADSAATEIIRKVDSLGTPLGLLADVQRGVTPFQLTGSPRHRSSRAAFNGTIRRYLHEPGEPAYIRFDDTLAEPKPERYFVGPRLLLRELISRQFRLQAMRVDNDFVTNKSMQSILSKPNGPDLNYLLGVINSRLISWYFLKRSNIAQRDDFPKIVLRETRLLPIPPVVDNSRDGRERHAKFLQLVSQLLDLGRLLQTTRTQHEREVIGRQFDSLDRQVDQAVYKLFRLTKEQIAVVETEMT